MFPFLSFTHKKNAPRSFYDVAFFVIPRWPISARGYKIYASHYLIFHLQSDSCKHKKAED